VAGEAALDAARDVNITAGAESGYASEPGSITQWDQTARPVS